MDKQIFWCSFLSAIRDPEETDAYTFKRPKKVRGYLYKLCILVIHRLLLFLRTAMADNTYQSPWRNSIVMAPSGRNFSHGAPGFRARPASGSFSRSSITQESLPPDLDIMDGIEDTPIQTIAVPNADSEQEDVAVTDCKCIGSYNWMKGETPTILVPGNFLIIDIVVNILRQ